MSDVVLVAVMLEEKLLVTPEGWSSLGASDQPADVSLWALLLTKLRWAVVAEYLEHSCVLGNNLKLLMEVVLVFVSPSVDIIRLNVNLEWPVGVLLFVTELIELGELHN